MEETSGRRVYEHLVTAKANDVLEIGTAHGVSACYMAAALDEVGGGKVTTLDDVRASFDPDPETVIGKAGLEHRIERVRITDSSYDWWLREMVERQSDAAGNCEPLYDFCYLDGAHNFTIDGLAVVLVEKLLRPGGWLLMDDLPWTYAQDPGREATDGIVHRELSEAERREPHLRAVFDLIVAQHPSFTDVRIQDEWWGWARKAPGEPRRYSVETSRPLGALVTGSLRRLKRRAQQRLRR
jgi:predicted O-methyltransferase YrrM